eukprot:5618272-Amphidinium_carterae.1
MSIVDTKRTRSKHKIILLQKCQGVFAPLPATQLFEGAFESLCFAQAVSGFQKSRPEKSLGPIELRSVAMKTYNLPKRIGQFTQPVKGMADIAT